MNLMTFRFLVAVIASLSLVLAGSIVLTDNYERRLASYNEDFQRHQEQNFSGKTYSSFMPRLDRVPNPLSLFNQGLDKRAKNSLQIKIGEVAFLWGNVNRLTGFSNPFRYLLADIDLVSIFQILSTQRDIITRAYSASRRRTLCVIRSTTASPPANPCDQSVVAAVKTVPPCV